MQDLYLIDMESVGANTLNGGRQDLYSANAVFEKMEITGRYVITQFSFEVEFQVHACEGWQWKGKYNMIEVSHHEVMIGAILEQDKPVLAGVPLYL